MLGIRKTLHSNQIYLLQSMPYAEHTENFVPYPDFLQQSDLFAAINVICEQTRLYDEHTENFAPQLDLFAVVLCEIHLSVAIRLSAFKIGTHYKKYTGKKPFSNRCWP